MFKINNNTYIHKKLKIYLDESENNKIKIEYYDKKEKYEILKEIYKNYRNKIPFLINKNYNVLTYWIYNPKDFDLLDDNDFLYRMRLENYGFWKTWNYFKRNHDRFKEMVKNNVLYKSWIISFLIYFGKLDLIINSKKYKYILEGVKYTYTKRIYFKKYITRKEMFKNYTNLPHYMYMFCGTGRTISTNFSPYRRCFCVGTDMDKKKMYKLSCPYKKDTAEECLQFDCPYKKKIELETGGFLNKNIKIKLKMFLKLYDEKTKKININNMIFRVPASPFINLFKNFFPEKEFYVRLNRNMNPDVYYGRKHHRLMKKDRDIIKKEIFKNIRNADACFNKLYVVDEFIKSIIPDCIKEEKFIMAIVRNLTRIPVNEYNGTVYGEIINDLYEQTIKHYDSNHKINKYLKIKAMYIFTEGLHDDFRIIDKNYYIEEN